MILELQREIRTVSMAMGRKLPQQEVETDFFYDLTLIAIKYCPHYSLEDFTKKNRQKEIVMLKNIIKHILRYKYYYSLPKIAKNFQCHHATVIHNIRFVDTALIVKKGYKDYVRAYEFFCKNLN